MVVAGLRCQGAQRHGSRSVGRGAPRSGDRAAAGDASTAPQCCWGAGIPLPGRIFLRTGLRGCTIRVVAFRAFHTAKPPSRQRRFVQRFPKYRAASLAAKCRVTAKAPPHPIWESPVQPLCHICCQGLRQLRHSQFFWKPFL